MDLQVTPSQRQLEDAHRQRLDKFWPQRHKAKPAKRIIRRPKPVFPSMDEQFAIAWEMLSGPQCRGSMREIQDLVCEHFAVPFLYMETTRRAQEYYLPRSVAIYLCRKFTKQSNPSIGRTFKRDASSIWACIKAVENLIALNHPIAADIEILSSKLRGFHD